MRSALVRTLRNYCRKMKHFKLEPMSVYIVIIGDRKFMCPVSSLPEELTPMPCEIIGSPLPGLAEEDSTIEDEAPYSLRPVYRLAETAKQPSEKGEKV